MPTRPAPLRHIPVGDTDFFTPSRSHPVRLRARAMPADTHFEPHAHAWGQLAYCATGVVQVTAQRVAGDSAAGEVTYIVPPSRAVWIAPGALHHITVLEAAEFRTLYIHAAATPKGWKGCRVLMVSAMLREAVHALDGALTSLTPEGLVPARAKREKLLTQLVLDELAHADAQALGVPMPHPLNGDKRLRALCDAVLRAPGARTTLAAWTADIGASERTMARLFRDELGMSYQQWRQQAVLAHALPLLTGGQSVSAVAAASGYASDSAFSAMFRAAMGQPPSHFQKKSAL